MTVTDHVGTFVPGEGGRTAILALPCPQSVEFPYPGV